MTEWRRQRSQSLVLAALLFALCAPAVIAQTSTPRVTLSGAVDPVVAGSDQSVNAMFEITLPDGYHVNSNAPLDEFLKPTRQDAAKRGVSVVAAR